MLVRQCGVCQVEHPLDAFRSGRADCTWCHFSSMEKRAVERYKDKKRADARRQDRPARLLIDQPEFVSWYVSQPDCCHYCGTTFEELRKLRLRRSSWGYYVSWDIDRLDSTKPYQAGNMALSCFMCNMAKGDYLSASEARVLAKAVREIVLARLRNTEAA